MDELILMDHSIGLILFFLGVLYEFSHQYWLIFAALIPIFVTFRAPFAVFFLMGMFVTFIHEYHLTSQLPGQIIPNALIEGSIASIPIITPNKTQFIFKATKFNGKTINELMQLSCYQKQCNLHALEQWQFAVKLKKPHNFNNPGGFDYASLLRSKHIQWTGYIRNSPKNQLLNKKSNWQPLFLRNYLARRIDELEPNARHASIIKALALNLTAEINTKDWDLFRNTGTTHLFGISGEHVGFIFGAMFFVLFKLWSLSSYCCALFRARAIASVFGFLASCAYGYLTGFAPPIQRGLMGCFFYTTYCLGKTRLSPWQIWYYSLFVVLCIEPHAVFMQGFYFSFLAAFCLLLTQQYAHVQGLKRTLLLQCSCMIGLTPLTLYWYAYTSLNGLIANLIAIALVSFVIIPLCLLVVLFCSFSWVFILVKPLSWSIALLFQWLIWIEHLSFLNPQWPVTSQLSLMASMGGLLILTVLRTRFTACALIWITSILLPHRPAIKPGEVLLQVLDVGQGLAVSVRTQNHTLLYDTGDRWYQGSDSGKMVVLPFYRTVGVNQIDMIVISHPDKDHLGGLKSIETSMAVDHLVVNDPLFYHRGMNCHHYSNWDWDGVHFQFLPMSSKLKGKNNFSCVLQISNNSGGILLTGDIEQPAEDYLVTHHQAHLKSDILVVPHHGSQTSCSYRFLLEVAPKYAIASLGWDNRFHFPHPKVVARFKSLNIPLLRTDRQGMIECQLPAHNMPFCK